MINNTVDSSRDAKRKQRRYRHERRRFLHRIRTHCCCDLLRFFFHPAFLEKLTAKGLKKFIAYEISVNELKEKYGKHFDLIMNDLHQTDDLRVLDYDGHRVFNKFTLSKMSKPIYHEP